MTPGRVGYEAYREHITHALYQGPMMPWPMLDSAMKDAWETSAQAVIEHYIEVKEVEEENLTQVKKPTDG